MPPFGEAGCTQEKPTLGMKRENNQRRAPADTKRTKPVGGHMTRVNGIEAANADGDEIAGEPVQSGPVDRGAVLTFDGIEWRHRVAELDVRAYATADGVQDDTSAVAAASYAAEHLLFTPGTYWIASHLTIPKAMRFLNGAVLRPGSGATIVLEGPLDAGRYQVFDLSDGGTVTFGVGGPSEACPEWWGAVGDGVHDDTAALQAAVAAAAVVRGTVTFPIATTHLISQTIFGVENLRWSFNDTTFLADPSGSYHHIDDADSNDTGFLVFFATDGAANSIYAGRLTLEGNGTPNLCGISAADQGSSRGNQRWEWIELRNLERGIYALDQGTAGNTIVGHHFGTVEGYANGFDLYCESGGSDDVVFDVFRSQSSPQATDAGKANIFLHETWGIVIHSLFIRGQRSDRNGLVLSEGASLVCDHLYVEGIFGSPVFLSGPHPSLRLDNVKVSRHPMTSANGQVIEVDDSTDRCVLDVTINACVLSSSNISHLIRLNTADDMTYGRTVLLRVPFAVGDTTPIVYVGAGASDVDNVVVYAQGGRYRYFYDGSTTTGRLEPWVQAAATPAATLGEVTAKIEVFDTHGRSLGFMPIYDSIK